MTLPARLHNELANLLNILPAASSRTAAPPLLAATLYFPRPVGGCSAAPPWDKVQALPQLAGPLALCAEGVGSAQPAGGTAARCLLCLPQVTQGVRLPPAERRLPPGEEEGETGRYGVAYSRVAG